jgi:hypothetical protein
MANNSPEPYRHSPLKESDSFRVIELAPSGDQAATLQCDLFHTTLRQAREDIISHYIVLSYVWGDPELKATILVGGQQLNVTKSLDCALKHLRDEERAFYV